MIEIITSLKLQIFVLFFFYVTYFYRENCYENGQVSTAEGSACSEVDGLLLHNIMEMKTVSTQTLPLPTDPGHDRDSSLEMETRLYTDWIIFSATVVTNKLQTRCFTYSEFEHW